VGRQHKLPDNVGENIRLDPVDRNGGGRRQNRRCAFSTLAIIPLTSGNPHLNFSGNCKIASETLKFSRTARAKKGSSLPPPASRTSLHCGSCGLIPAFESDGSVGFRGKLKGNNSRRQGKQCPMTQSIAAPVPRGHTPAAELVLSWNFISVGTIKL
jgi:hypothetical protein